MKLDISVFAVLSAVLLSSHACPAAVSWVSPGQSLTGAIALLRAGDTLNVRGGIYRVPSVNITVQGQAGQWIVVQAAPGEIPIVRGTSPTSNLFAIRGAAYLVLDGIEIDSVPPDVMPIRFERNYGVSHDILVRNFHIHDVPSIAVDAKGDHYNVVFRRCHIHHTRDGTAEGFYIGDHTGSDHPHHWTIENCWIHHTGYLNSTQGDGIELKYGCYAMIVRNNVIYNTAYPAILVYGYNGDNSDGSRTCLIEGNAVWNADEAIGVYADAVVRNNIVFASSWPVSSMQYTGHKAPENVQIYNNTFYDFDAVYLRAWDSTKHCVFANNAAYRTVSGSCLNFTGTGTFYNNVATGAGPGCVVSSAANDLADPAAKNVYPRAGSLLVNGGTGPCAARTDFNGTIRDASPDIGAYEFSAASNPGWAVVEAFKDGGPTDTLSVVFPGIPDPAGGFSMDVFPNPLSRAGRIGVRLGRDVSAPFVFSVYDARGQRVLCREETGTRFSWDLISGNGQRVAPGRYVIRLDPVQGEKRIAGARGFTVE